MAKAPLLRTQLMVRLPPEDNQALHPSGSDKFVRRDLGGWSADLIQRVPSPLSIPASNCIGHERINLCAFQDEIECMAHAERTD